MMVFVCNRNVDSVHYGLVVSRNLNGDIGESTWHEMCSDGRDNKVVAVDVEEKD